MFWGRVERRTAEQNVGIVPEVSEEIVVPVSRFPGTHRFRPSGFVVSWHSRHAVCGRTRVRAASGAEGPGNAEKEP